MSSCQAADRNKNAEKMNLKCCRIHYRDVPIQVFDCDIAVLIKPFITSMGRRRSELYLCLRTVLWRPVRLYRSIMGLTCNWY